MSNLKNAISNSAAETTETKSNPPISMGEIVLYQPEGEIKLEVRVENETVWLTIDQMALLFAKSRSTINEHILNAFSEKELEKSQSVRKIGNSDFSTKPTNYYNLDVIISVGYRVKSIQGTHFRRWANKAEGVSVTIYSAWISHQFKEEAALYKKQHPEFDLRTMRIIHDRFLLVDDTVYHFGASFKDMGAEFSAYSVLNFVTPEEVIEKVKEITKGL